MAKEICTHAVLGVVARVQDVDSYIGAGTVIISVTFQCREVHQWGLREHDELGRGIVLLHHGTLPDPAELVQRLHPPLLVDVFIALAVRHRHGLAGVVFERDNGLYAANL